MQRLDAIDIDSVQLQLAELAERQDCTGRMLIRQPRKPRMDDVTPVPTPI